jgi:hypothetical protein
MSLVPDGAISLAALPIMTAVKGLHGAGTGGIEGGVKGLAQGAAVGGGIGGGGLLGAALGRALANSLPGGTIDHELAKNLGMGIGGLGGGLLAASPFRTTNKIKQLSDKQRLEKLEGNEAKSKAKKEESTEKAAHKLLKLAKEAAEAPLDKKKKKKGLPSWLLAPAGLGAAAGLGGAYTLASDQHADTMSKAIENSKLPLGADETPLSKYTQTMSHLANSSPAGVPIGELLAKARSSRPLMVRAGFPSDSKYIADTPGSFQEARMHYDAFKKGPVAALYHMMQPEVRGRTPVPQDLVPANLKGKTYAELMNPHFREAWKKFVAKKLPGGEGWLSPLEADTKVIPHKEQLEFFKEYENSIPADLKAVRKKVEGGMEESLEGNIKNYMPIANKAIKARQLMKNVGITSAGAGAGGLLGHYLHGALADEDNPSTLGYLASTLGGAGLGGAASYFGGTEQGRKTMSDAAAKLMSLMQKKSAEAKMCGCCKKSPCECPPNCSCGCKNKSAAAKPGLWANIRAKKERGEAAAKPGDKDYPTSKNWKKVTEESEKKAYGEIKPYKSRIQTAIDALPEEVRQSIMSKVTPEGLDEVENDPGYNNVLALNSLLSGGGGRPSNTYMKKKFKDPNFREALLSDIAPMAGVAADAIKAEKKASPAWQTSEGKSESGGLNDKGRASLKAQGHDIKRPQPEGGPRKDSFCARMKGMKAKLTSEETARDPDSRINKSLRKWKCGSAATKLAALLKTSKCWEGYERVPGTKPLTPGSCRPVGGKKKEDKAEKSK